MKRRMRGSSYLRVFTVKAYGYKLPLPEIDRALWPSAFVKVGTM